MPSVPYISYDAHFPREVLVLPHARYLRKSRCGEAQELAPCLVQWTGCSGGLHLVLVLCGGSLKLRRQEFDILDSFRDGFLRLESGLNVEGHGV